MSEETNKINPMKCSDIFECFSQGLDDMEDDILGSLRKKTPPAPKQPALSQTVPAKSSFASGKNAVGKAKPKFDIDDIMADDGDNFDSMFASKLIVLNKAVLYLRTLLCGSMLKVFLGFVECQGIVPTNLQSKTSLAYYATVH